MPTPLHDVIIIGGGPAGLSAALLLGRARRRILLCDAGRPRNAPAPASHALFTRDGASPHELLTIARDQLRAYPTVEHIPEAIIRGHPGPPIELTTATGRALFARKALIATGVIDVLPPIPGVAECWGKTIFPCPVCHAHEFQGQPLAVLANGPHAVESVALMRTWSDQVTLCTSGIPNLDLSHRQKLYQRGVPVIEAPIAAFHHDAGQLQTIAFADGTQRPCRALLFSPRQQSASDLPVQLGLVPSGAFEVDYKTSRTSHPDIYVAGDLAALFPPQLLISAAYGGAFAARQIIQALALEDFL